MTMKTTTTLRLRRRRPDERDDDALRRVLAPFITDEARAKMRGVLFDLLGTMVHALAVGAADARSPEWRAEAAGDAEAMAALDGMVERWTQIRGMLAEAGLGHLVEEAEQRAGLHQKKAEWRRG